MPVVPVAGRESWYITGQCFLTPLQLNLQRFERTLGVPEYGACYQTDRHSFPLSMTLTNPWQLE